MTPAWMEVFEAIMFHDAWVERWPGGDYWLILGAGEGRGRKLPRRTVQAMVSRGWLEDPIHVSAAKATPAGRAVFSRIKG